MRAATLLGRRASGPSSISAERQALADAIGPAQAEADELAAASAALQPAIERIWAAEGAVRTAEEGLVTARANASAEVTTALLAGQVAPPVSLREARSRVLDAEDAVDNARAVRGEIEARLSQARTGLQAHKLDRAVAAVMAAEGAERGKHLGQQLIRLQRDMMTVVDELRWLVASGAVAVVEAPGGSFGRPVDRDVDKALTRLVVVNPEWDALIPQPPPRQGWVDAVAALSEDARAPLPTAG